MKKTSKTNSTPLGPEKNIEMGESIPVNLGTSFNPPKERYIRSIFNQWAGEREEAIADLTIYLENPTAVGEHPNIGEEIKNKLEEVDKYDSLMETIQKHFMTDSNLKKEAP